MTGTSNACDSAIDELLRAAIAAPSLHNAQPWRLLVKNAGTTIEMFADPDRMLPVTDPQGRSAYISCGAALLNLRVAATAKSLRADVTLTPDSARPLFVAQVALSGGHRATPQDGELAAAISLRHTSREPYSNDAVPPDIRTELAEAAQSEGCVLRFLDDNEAVRVLRLTTDAERELLEDPAYRAELARWVGKEGRDDGIPADALGPRSWVGNDPVRDFAPRRSEPVRYAHFEESPQLTVLSVRADSVPNWIAAGQALERIWLTATCRGISLCPATQPLETPDAWLVRDTRWGFDYPQVIMRVGYGPPVRTHSPRRAVRDVVDWS
jgi:Nitroreductase family